MGVEAYAATFYGIKFEHKDVPNLVRMLVSEEPDKCMMYLYALARNLVFEEDLYSQKDRDDLDLVHLVESNVGIRTFGDDTDYYYLYYKPSMMSGSWNAGRSRERVLLSREEANFHDYRLRSAAIDLGLVSEDDSMDLTIREYLLCWMG